MRHWRMNKMIDNTYAVFHVLGFVRADQWGSSIDAMWDEFTDYATDYSESDVKAFFDSKNFRTLIQLIDNQNRHYGMNLYSEMLEEFHKKYSPKCPVCRSNLNYNGEDLLVFDEDRNPIALDEVDVELSKRLLEKYLYNYESYLFFKNKSDER